MSLNLKIKQQVSLQDTQYPATTNVWTDQYAFGTHPVPANPHHHPHPNAPTNPPFPNPGSVFEPSFKEIAGVNFLTTATTYTNYISGDKEVLNAGQSVVISPTFATQFIMITSSLLYDVTLTQPGYTRKVQGVSASFPENTFTVTTVQDSWIQFGMFSEIVITSRQNANKFKWLIMGNEPSELSYITLTNNTLTSAASPYLAVPTAAIPLFNVPYKQYIYVAGAGGVGGSPGPSTITNTPSIAPGYYLNQQITVVGTNNTNTVTINNGQGTSQNGPVTLGLDGSIDYYWNGSYWSEEYRR